MHVDAVSATVDLRGACLDEVKQAGLEPGPANLSFKLRHRMVDGRCGFRRIQTCCHSSLSLLQIGWLTLRVGCRRRIIASTKLYRPAPGCAPGRVSMQTSKLLCGFLLFAGCLASQTITGDLVV